MQGLFCSQYSGGPCVLNFNLLLRSAATYKQIIQISYVFTKETCFSYVYLYIDHAKYQIYHAIWHENSLFLCFLFDFIQLLTEGSALALLHAK